MSSYEEEIDISNKIKSKYNCNIITSNVEPYTLYKCSDIGNILQLRNIRSSLNNHERVIIITDSNGGPQKSIFLTYKGLVKLLINSRKPNVIEFCKNIDLQTNTIYYACIESDILKCILTTFTPNIMIEQYSIGKYKIDLYFPEKKIAIECDEKHDTKLIKENDIIRQLYIEEKLKCKFIRFKPYDKNFNLFKLLNEIYIHLST